MDRVPRQLRALALLGALALSLAGCAGEQGGLAGAAHSPEEVAEQALTALARGDHGALLSLLVTEEEHRRLVWPELPASDPSGNIDPGFAFENMQLRSRRDLGRSEKEWRERPGPDPGPPHVVSVAASQVEAHRTIRIHGGLQVLIREGDRAPQPLRLLGSIVERDGQFKLLAYRR